jgi:hypothetical protein
VVPLLYVVLLPAHLRHLQLSWPRQHQVVLPLQLLPEVVVLLVLLLLVLLLVLLVVLLLGATKGVQEGRFPLLLLLPTMPRSLLSAR